MIPETKSMDKIRPHILFTAVIAFAVVVVAIFFFRANPPAEKLPARQTPKEFTYGNFISGPLTVPKGELLAYKFELNRKAGLTGKFVTENYRPKISVYLVSPENLELMKSGSEFSSITTTGEVPGGKVTRTLEPGAYYVVFDNRKGSNDAVVPEVDFSIE